jgi:hypothetical protein
MLERARVRVCVRVGARTPGARARAHTHRVCGASRELLASTYEYSKYRLVILLGGHQESPKTSMSSAGPQKPQTPL